VLTTSAFETFLGPARVERGRTLEAPSAGLEDDERLSQSVRTFIEQRPFPPRLQARIVKTFAELAQWTELWRAAVYGCTVQRRLGGRRRRQFRWPI